MDKILSVGLLAPEFESGGGRFVKLYLQFKRALTSLESEQDS
jgi:hypothetical protein